MIGRGQHLGHLGIAHGAADIVAHEVAQDLVGLDLGEEIGEGAEQLDAANLPEFLQRGEAFLGDR
ncbi:MAG TPA: hypothetical protein VGC36_04185, partial [Rhizomicrobium sp.]